MANTQDAQKAPQTPLTVTPGSTALMIMKTRTWKRIETMATATTEIPETRPTKIGRTRAFNRPRIRTAAIRAPTPEIVTLGSRAAVASRAIAAMSTVRMRRTTSRPGLARHDQSRRNWVR